MDTTICSKDVSPTTGSTKAETVQRGRWIWMGRIGNDSQAAVSAATVTAMSGYDPSHFDESDAVVSFPWTRMLGDVAPGESQGVGLGSDIPATCTMGFDSTRTVTPSMIPAGGGRQTVTVSVTPVDSRYLAKNASVGVNITNPSPGTVTLTSGAGPTNLNQGEELHTEAPDSAHGQLASWTLSKVQLGKRYVFTVVLDVHNDYPLALEYRPLVGIDGSERRSTSTYAGSSVTIPEPTLDGAVRGAGKFTFSVADSGRVWEARQVRSYTIFYGAVDLPSELPVPIEVKPGSHQPAHVNLKTEATVPVAVLSTSWFNAVTEVDVSTVDFSTMGPGVSPVSSAAKDVNRDGRPDLVLTFPVQGAVPCDGRSVSLRGKTRTGEGFSGSAPVVTTGCGQGA